MHADSRLAAILRSLDVVVFETDRDGLVRVAEGEGLRAAGLGPRDIVGHALWAIFGDAPWVMDCFRRGLAGASASADGLFHARHLRCELSPARDQLGRVTGVLGMLHDVTTRLPAEQVARTTARRLELLSERGPLVIYSRRLTDDPPTLELSPSVVAQLGHTPEQLAGPKYWLDLVHPDDQARVLAGRAALFEQGQQLLEYRFRHGDGSWRWLHDEATLVRDAAGRPEELHGFLVDVSARHAAREYASHSIAFESRAIAEAEIGIIVFDTKMRYRVWNPYLERVLGVAFADVVGRHPWDVFPELTLQQVKRDIKRALCGTVTSGMSESFHRVTGARVLLAATLAPMQDADGKVIGVVLLLRDVTEQRRLQEAVDSSQRSFRAVIDDAPDGMLVQREGKIVFVNRSLLRLLGHDNDAGLVGRSLLELVRPEQRELAARRLVAADAPLASSQDYVFVGKGGREVPVELRSTAVSFAGQASRRAICRDQTERLQLQAQLMASDRLSSVGALAAGVAHEINNPLAAILANLESGLRDLEQLRGIPGVVAALDPLRDARDAAVRLKDIARDLKLFSRAEDERVVPVDLANVIDATLRLAQNEIRHRAQLRKDYRPVPQVMGNEAQLGQVFLNLIINATQAIPEGKAIENELAVVLRTDELGRAVVEVRDSGVGIAPAVLTRIFDPFFTTKPAGVGTGLGLAVCQRLVTAAGGSISAESELGKGSLFRVVLPPARALEPSSAQPTPVAAPQPQIRGAVLVIDDDATVAKSIARTLRRKHEVTVETDAASALVRVRAREHFDMILCDIMMPSMTGIQFYDELCSFAPAVAELVVFMTGGVFSHEAREFLDRVPNTLVEKPFDPVALNLLIDERLRRSR